MARLTTLSRLPLALRLVLVMLVLGSSLILGGGRPITALAGSNGQQLDFIDHIGIYSICLSGTNQNGVHIPQPGHNKPCFTTPNYGSNDINGWWWVGALAMDTYDGAGRYAGTYGTTVPRSQSPNYWCFNDQNGSAYGCTG